ncbi:MAG: hypothetical protein KDK26_02795 [Roseivivax sp.]|nr:hypothetical protein [Roseivivax sp.]
MDDLTENSVTPVGLYDRAGAVEIQGPNVAAIAVGVAWVVLATVVIVWAGRQGEHDSVYYLVSVMLLVLPLIMIWVAASALRAARILSDESARLRLALETMRRNTAGGAPGRDGPMPLISRKLEEIAAAQRKTEAAMAVFTTRRAETPAEEASKPNYQPALELNTPDDAKPVPMDYDDFIRALDFPKTAEDVEGFAALRRAMKDRQVGLLVRASQDVLTLLSQDGIYMDDLKPDLAKPEVWRRFAKGERGRTIAALGGIRDRSSLALAANRMKQDTIFRDAVHHFLRLFDRTFVKFEAEASDPEITEFAGTRTSRAFMLLSRVAGTFD